MTLLSLNITIAQWKKGLIKDKYIILLPQIYVYSIYIYYIFFFKLAIIT